MIAHAKKFAKNVLGQFLFVQELPASCAGSVLLTFDDGPDARVTPRVLDVLEGYGVRACFFMVGQRAASEPGLLREVAARGHVIGNHSYLHRADHPSLSEYVADVGRCQETIMETTGAAAELFRPPMGRISLAGTLACRKLGLRQVLWSIEGGEWGIYKGQTADEIGSRLATATKGRDIVLLHDDNEKTPAVLKMFLPVLAEREIDLSGGVCHLTRSR